MEKKRVLCLAVLMLVGGSLISAQTSKQESPPGTKPIQAVQDFLKTLTERDRRILGNSFTGLPPETQEKLLAILKANTVQMPTQAVQPPVDPLTGPIITDPAVAHTPTNKGEQPRTPPSGRFQLVIGSISFFSKSGTWVTHPQALKIDTATGAVWMMVFGEADNGTQIKGWTLIPDPKPNQ